MNLAFWKDKRVFITGHTGFKGSWLCLWLQALGAQVTGYALPAPTKPSLFETAQVKQAMHSIVGNILDQPKLQKALLDSQAEIVIHLAAQSLVRYSYANPIETYTTNVMGTVHLLETVRHVSTIKAVVNVTSDKCYDNHESLRPFQENEPMGGYDPYSSSKGCAELITAAYRSSFFNSQYYDTHGVALASARAGNVIGGGDWAPERLIPDILSAFTLGQPVTIRHPYAIRPWQHVLESLRGYLILAEKLYTDGPAFAEAWNFGPVDEDVHCVQWVVEKLADLWGQNMTWKIAAGLQLHEAAHLKLDIAKVRTRLNWHPILPLSDALKMVVNWTQQSKKENNIQALTLTQIKDYQDLVI